MREKYQPQPTSVDWTTGSQFNTGGGILAGIAAGAETDLLDDAWWGPTIPLPNGPWFCLAERNLPGSIIVNQAGERYMNEALPYVEAVHEMYEGEATGVGHVPAWMVIDQRYRNRYLFAGLSPRQPFPGRWYKHGTVKKAATLEALAAEIDVPAATLRGDRSSGSTASRAAASTRTSTAASRPTTSTTPTRRSSRTRRCTSSTRRPSTPSRSCPATSAPRAAWSPTSGPGCCGRRLGDRGPVRRRQRLVRRDGPHLRRPRRHHRPRPGLRLPGRRGHRGRRRLPRWSPR